jgi:hypothetical protein
VEGADNKGWVVQKAILGPKAQSTPESNKKKWSQAKKRFSAAHVWAKSGATISDTLDLLTQQSTRSNAPDQASFNHLDLVR